MVFLCAQTPMQLFEEGHQARFKKSEVLATIFKSRKVRYYSCNALTDSSDSEEIGIASMCRADKQVIVIGSDYCLDQQNKWNSNKLSIEKQKHLSLSKLLSFGKTKKQNKIGGAISLKIIAANLCFATTADGLFSFACGFEDHSFVIWDVTNSSVLSTVKQHQDVVSCLALDENVEKHKAILVTGSYDKSVMVWRVNMHNDKIDIHPVHVLENQLAAITCVDISMKSGIIVCCSLDGIVNVYNSSTGDHYHMLQPFVDKAMKERKEMELKIQKERLRKSKNLQNDEDEKKEDEDEDDVDVEEQDELKQMESSPSPKMEPLKNGIECSVLTAVRVSDVFGRILCYSKQTKDMFLYSSKGEMISYSSSGDDIFEDIKFSKSGNHMVCGGRNAIVRIKQLPSFRTQKKFKEATKYKKAITSVYLSKDETYMLVGTANGNVLVYSLPQKAFVNVRIGALGRHGF